MIIISHLATPPQYFQVHVSALMIPWASTSFSPSWYSHSFSYESHSIGSTISANNYRFYLGASSWQVHHVHKALAF